MQAAGKRYIIHDSRADVITIWFLSDLHIGNKATEMDRLRRDIERIKADPRSFWIGGGDYADYIGVGDKRFDPAEFPDDIMVADLAQLGWVMTRKVRDLFSPISGKCLGLLMGNHEKKYQQINQQENLHSWLCTELKVPNLGYSAFMDVMFVRGKSGADPKLEYKAPPQSERHNVVRKRIFCHHGCGAATTPGGKLNRLIQIMHMFEADLYFIGHVHDQKAQRLIRISCDENCAEIKEIQKLGIISGSYLKTYAQGVTSYGEIKGYAPVPLGATAVQIAPDKDEMHAVV